MSARRYWPLAVVAAIGVWALWSYAAGGVVHALVSAALDSDGSIDALRAAIESTGALAPVVYVAAVIVEVLVAPIPGVMLYLPGGAIFGGFRGGLLALTGNVIGAALAAWIAATIGTRVLRVDDWPRLQRYSDVIARRGLVVIILLRLNPLTSSDLVSYAAGFVGVSVWRVALGTAIGMAPLCFAQAYASEWLFRWLPASGLVVLLLGAAYFIVVLFVVFRGARNA